MKNELVMSAIRFKTAKQLQEEEMKNLVFYRDECEHAWRAMSVSEERERDAMRIIDDLKSEIDGLQDQVKTLLGIETVPPHHHHASSKAKFDKTTTTPTSLAEDQTSLSPVRSPLRKFFPAPSPSPLSSPSKGSAVDPSPPPPMLSFDEWKISTRVWSPPTTGATQKAPTPTQDELFTQQHKLEMARCVSVPALQPTAMERATTAVASGSISPSRRHQLLEPRRATTSVHSKRSQQPVLPSVSTRRA
jgi:hypothetical protein